MPARGRPQRLPLVFARWMLATTRSPTRSRSSSLIAETTVNIVFHIGVDVSICFRTLMSDTPSARNSSIRRGKARRTSPFTLRLSLPAPASGPRPWRYRGAAPSSRCVRAARRAIAW